MMQPQSIKKFFLKPRKKLLGSEVTGKDTQDKNKTNQNIYIISHFPSSFQQNKVNIALQVK
jgi:hypothetical protein